MFDLKDAGSSAVNKNTKLDESGFTLLELLFVLVMVGILSAIAPPSWLAFVNRQRVNVANDAVLRALQEAQREAKRRKLSYSVSFRTDAKNQVPHIALHPASVRASKLRNDLWKPLGADLQLKPGQIWMGTNFKGNNSTVNSVSVPPSKTSSTTPTITFDYTGALPLEADIPLQVVVAVPPSSGSKQPLDSTKRCVIIQTLLGSMRTAKGSDCNIKTPVNIRNNNS